MTRSFCLTHDLPLHQLDWERGACWQRQTQPPPTRKHSYCRITDVSLHQVELAVSTLCTHDRRISRNPRPEMAAANVALLSYLWTSPKHKLLESFWKVQTGHRRNTAKAKLARRTAADPGFNFQGVRFILYLLFMSNVSEHGTLTSMPWHSCRGTEGPPSDSHDFREARCRSGVRRCLSHDVAVCADLATVAVRLAHSGSRTSVPYAVTVVAFPAVCDDGCFCLCLSSARGAFTRRSWATFAFGDKCVCGCFTELPLILAG